MSYTNQKHPVPRVAVPSDEKPLRSIPAFAGMTELQPEQLAVYIVHTS
jgi:hypothetical protein